MNLLHTRLSCHPINTSTLEQIVSTTISLATKKPSNCSEICFLSPDTKFFQTPPAIEDVNRQLSLVLAV